MNSKIIFLDRDEVINQTPKGQKYILHQDQIIFEQANILGLQKLAMAGFKFIVVTNQRCINSGLISVSELRSIHDFIKNHLLDIYGIEILDFFYCPHLITDNCECRKPKPGMLIEARNQYKITGQSIMIGDQLTDCLAAIQANISCILIKNNNQSGDEELVSSSLYLGYSDNIDLAVQKIISFYSLPV